MTQSTTELTENSTSEDVSAYADQVAKEVAIEREGDKKSDAQITSGLPENQNTPAVTESGKLSAAFDNDDSDDSDLENQVEDSEETDSGPEWLTDDVKAEAAAYGINEEEISDFTSREELDRALRLFDKTALDAGRKAMAEGEDGKTRDEKGKFVKKEEPKQDHSDKDRWTKEQSASSKNETPQDGRYSVSLDPDLYDESIISEFTNLRDHYESRFEALESHFHEVTAKAEEERFDSLVDSLELADLFGKTGHESENELQRRQDLHVALKAQMIGLEKLGRPTELNQNLIARVARMVYADEIGKKELKQRTRKMSQKSDRRQGGGATRPQSPAGDPREDAERLYRELAGS